MLLERRQPLAELAGHWQSARAGAGGLSLLEGEAGIGKTSVVRELVRTSTGRIVVGACDAMSTPRPLGPLIDIAPQLSSELAELLGTDALYPALLRALAQPTLVVIEDAHWADAATLDLLRYLGRRIATLPSMLLVTYRDDEVGARHPLRIVLGDLATAGTLRRVALARLSVAAVKELAHETEAEIEIDATVLHRRTGGNPFFVTEVLAARTLGVPVTVRDAVLARVARLDDDARATTEAVATLGVHGRVDVLVEMLAGHCSLEPAIDAGILTSAATFRHELGREAVLSSIMPDRQQALHAAALAALAKSPRSHELAALAHHAEGAGDAEAARRYGLAAARHAVQLRSHREAAAQYARAAKFFAGDSAEHAEVLEAWAYEEYLTGNPAKSAELRLAVAEMWHRLGNEVRHGDNLRWVSRVSWFAGRRDDADRYGQLAVDVLAKLPPGRELAAAWSNQSHLAMLAHQAATGARLGKKALALARKVGDRETEVHALNNVGTSRLVTGDLGGIPDIERSLVLAKELGLGEHVGRAYTNLSTSLSVGRQLARAIALFDEGIAYCDDHDLDAWRIYMLGWRAMAELHAGRLDAAVGTATYTLARATAAVSRVHPLVALGRARARGGDPDVWAPLDEALAIALPIGEIQRIGISRIGRAEAAWLAGDDARAVEEAEAGLAVAAQVQDGWAAGELVMYAILAGGQPEVPPWIAKPFALFAQGELAASAKSWEELGCPYERVIAGPDDEESLRAGFIELERLHMSATAAAVGRKLRALGVRSVPRGRRASTRANKAGLTAREVEVLELLAEGLRNSEIGKRLFISAKTVDHHVSAILAKLDLPDRGAAAKWHQSGGSGTAI